MSKCAAGSKGDRTHPRPSRVCLAGCRLRQSLRWKKLNKFKGLASAYSVASRPRLVGTYIAECLLYHPYFANELDDVEAALLRLQTRIDDPRLKPILGKLFGQLELGSSAERDAHIRLF